MGKESRARVLPKSQAKAIGSMIRVSPRKLNLVAQTIRGKRAEAAAGFEDTCSFPPVGAVVELFPERRQLLCAFGNELAVGPDGALNRRQVG